MFKNLKNLISVVLVCIVLAMPFGAVNAGVIYWNLFNREDNSTQTARYVTYATLADMLNDENRLGPSIAPDGSSAGQNVIGSGSDGTTYWNLFNREDNSTQTARYVTYANLADMLNDENRLGPSIAPDGSSAGQNIIGSGSDGTTYWNLFNREDNSTQTARYVIYANLADMLNDENRLGPSIAPDGSSAGQNVIGSGSDGTTYWNLFNREDNSTQTARYVTYANLADMLNDENRLGPSIAPDGSSAGQNIIGSGAFFSPNAIPEPSVLVLFGLGFAGLGFARRRKTV